MIFGWTTWGKEKTTNGNPAIREGDYKRDEERERDEEHSLKSNSHEALYVYIVNIIFSNVKVVPFSHIGCSQSFNGLATHIKLPIPLFLNCLYSEL